jgi:hypothetical protein
MPPAPAIPTGPSRVQQIAFRALAGFVAILMATVGGALASNVAAPNLSWNTLWPALLGAAILAFEKWWSTEGDTLWKLLLSQWLAQLGGASAISPPVLAQPAAPASTTVDVISPQPLMAAMATPAASPVTVNIHTTPPTSAPALSTSSALTPTPSATPTNGSTASGAVEHFGGDVVVSSAAIPTGG